MSKGQTLRPPHSPHFSGTRLSMARHMGALLTQTHFLSIPSRNKCESAPTCSPSTLPEQGWANSSPQDRIIRRLAHPFTHRLWLLLHRTCRIALLQQCRRHLITVHYPTLCRKCAEHCSRTSEQMGIRRGFTDKQKWRNRQHRGERGGGDIETPPP